MEAVLWDPERGAWFDYSLLSKSKHLEFYASNLAPVWAQCFSLPEMGERAVQYLKVGAQPQKTLQNKSFDIVFVNITKTYFNSVYFHFSSLMSGYFLSFLSLYFDASKVTSSAAGAMPASSSRWQKCTT